MIEVETSKMSREKALGLFRMRITGAMNPFRLHGLDVFIPGAVDEIIDWSLMLHKELEDAERRII